MSERLPPEIESAIAGLPMDDHCLETGTAQEAEANLREAISAQIATLTASAASTRRAALIEAAEMCEGEARAWEVVGLLDYARPLTAMSTRLRLLADQSTPPASREGASNA